MSETTKLGHEEAAVQCPKCGHPTSPNRSPQNCQKCSKRFILRAGCLLDTEIMPGPRQESNIKSKSSGLFLRKMSIVGPAGIAHGSLDPVTGLIPVDKLGIAYDDIFSIAIWRRLDWVLLVVTLIFFLPIDLLLGAGLFTESLGFLVGVIPFWGLTAFLLWKAIGVGVHEMRVCGSRLTLKMRYDSPFWRRRRFAQQAMARAGIKDVEVDP